MDGPSVSASGDRHSIVDWDEPEVQTWLASIGFPQYESNIQGIYIQNNFFCCMLF
jgi:protein STE50